MYTKQGGVGTLIKIAFRNIWRNKRRTAFCFSSVGITVLIMVVNQALVDGTLQNVSDTVQVFYEGHVRVVSTYYEAESEFMPVQYPVSDGENWKGLAVSIYEIPGVRAVLPRITANATLQESAVKHAILWGINISDEIQANNFNFANRSAGLVEGRWPDAGTNESAIGAIFARKSGLRIGDKIPLRTTSAHFSDRFWSPVITGIFDFDFNRFDEHYIIVDFERLQRLLVLNEGTQSLVVFADNENQSGTIAATIRNRFGNGNVVTVWNENFWVAMEKAKEPIYFIGFLVVLIVASFLNINTIVMIIFERTKEIGMMGSLGMTRIEIIKLFFFESFFLAAIGASVGVFIGGIITGILTNFPVHMGNFDGMSNTTFFQFSVIRIIQAWLMGVIVTSIFSVFPSLKSASMEPVEALRR